LVLGGVATETDLTAVSALLRQAGSAVKLFTPDERRPELSRMLADGTRALAEAAEPGSDHQLAFVRAYSSAAQDSDWLRTLLDGRLRGLTVDTDMRWTILTALARIGATGDADIDAELVRDNTISGQEHAAAARTIRPDPDAKEAA